MKVTLRKRWLVLLLCLVVGAALLGISYQVVRGLRARRQAAALLQQANRAEEQGHLDQAALALARYLRQAPRDADTRARYGRLLEQLATAPAMSPPVVNLLEEFLAAEPQRHDLRRRLAALELDAGAIDDAWRHLQILVAAFPKDGELVFQLGRCQELKRQDEEAAASYEAAILHAPTRVDSYQRLAHLLRRRLQQPDKAEEVLDQMVQANPKSFQAYLARATSRQEIDGSLRKAEGDVAEALRLAPDDSAVLLTAGELAQEQGKAAEARRHLERGLERHPREVRLYQALAGLELRAGRRPEAVACLRRGLKAVPDNSQLRWRLAEFAIEDGETKELPAQLEQLRQAKVPPARLEYLEARLKIKEEQWPEAARILERVRPRLVDAPDLTLQTELLLGRCYEHLGDPDRELEAFQRAAAAAPWNVAARAGSARALSRLGKPEAAAAELDKVMQLPQAPAAGWTLLAELLLVQNRRAPLAQRRWNKVEVVLARAAATTPEALEVPLLRADVLAAQGQMDQARSLIEEVRAWQPKQLQPWIALARWTAQREGKSEAVFAVLDEAERRLGDSAELRRARVQYLAERLPAESDKALVKLAAGVDRFAPKERGPLLLTLAEAFSRSGNLAEAGRLWQQAAAVLPFDLSIRSHLFEVALETDDEAALPQRLQDIQRLEGDGGPRGRYAEACRLVWLARRGDPQHLAPARALLAEVARQRPSWSQVCLRLAELDEREGKPEAAAEAYARAVELGVRKAQVLRRLVQLLCERQRYAEADEVLRKLEEQGPLAHDAQRLAAETALRNQDSRRAHAQARKAAPADSKDYRDFLWLGQFHADAGEPAEAEAAFRRAIGLAEQQPEGWVALVQHYVKSGQKDKAEAVLREAPAKLTKDQASLALARGYEALGSPAKAEEYLRAALAARPEELAVLRTAADFYLRAGQPQKAQPHLRKVLDAHPKAPAEVRTWARCGLALALATSGNSGQWRAALALLDQEVQQNGSGRDEQIARATVLGTRPGQRRESIRLFEALDKRHALTPAQRFHLAQLYEAEGDGLKARAGMQAVVTAHADNPLFLIPYVRSLLRQGVTDEAQLWLAKLQQLQPASFDTLSLQARLLAAQHQDADALAVLEKYVTDPAADPRFAAMRAYQVAQLLDLLAQEDTGFGDAYRPAAEKLYRQFAARSGTPDSDLVLADYLARQRRFPEALALCERAVPTCPPTKVAAVGAVVLQTGLAKDPPFELLEQWLARVLQQKPDAAAFLVLLGRLREQQGRYADAEVQYRKAIAQEPNYVVALNDLAYLLALRGVASGEALALIQRACDLRGLSAAFLDTRAVAYLAQGQTEAALEDLEEAIADTPTAVRYLHLARTHLAANNRTAAADALHKAQAAALTLPQLHPLDRDAYEQLRATVNPR